MTPRRIRLDGLSVAYARLSSPLGPLLAVSRDAALCGLYFLDEARRPVIRRDWRARPDLALFRRLDRQIAEYFAGTRRLFDVPLSPAGTPFQARVWRALSAVRYGRVTTYGTIARRLGAPRGARAVGAAVGRNPIGILVPCHRAVGAAGALTGYGGGLGRKRALLELERGVSDRRDRRPALAGRRRAAGGVELARGSVGTARRPARGDGAAPLPTRGAAGV